MAKGIFRDKEKQPDALMLALALGESGGAWEALAAYIGASFPAAAAEWKYYGKAWGWSLVYQLKKKGLIYATPNTGVWHASLSFNERGRAEARLAGFSDDIVRLIESGKNNAAGGTFDIEVQSEDGLGLIKQLIQIKAKTM